MRLQKLLMQTDVVLLDFQKAFDEVQHERLIDKLHHYGIQGNTNAWIRSFLSGCTQTVILEGERLDSIEITSGVPQGSVIGPLLFSVFINGLPTKLQSDVRLFRDDCIMYRQIRKEEDEEEEWLMHLHQNKCEMLKVTNQSKTLKSMYKKVSIKKYLEITLQSSWNWKTNMDVTCTKAYSTICLLKRNMGNCQGTVKSSFYKSLVRPILKFSLTVWNPHKSRNIKKLEMVQDLSIVTIAKRVAPPKWWAP